MSSDEDPGHQDVFEEGDEAAPPGVRTMSIVGWALIIGVGLIALFSFLHYFGAFEGASSAEGPAETIYYCPMHPQIQQDHPGECPICNMTLVPKSGSSESSQPSSQPASQPTSDVPGLVPLELGRDRVQLIGVRTAPVRRGRIAETIRTFGAITADEERVVKIHTRFAGWLEELRVDQSGQRVVRDQVLAAIYSPDLLVARQEYLNARTWDGRSSSTASLAEDARRRLELLGISATEIAELERERKPKHALEIRSPVAGNVIVKSAVKGLYVEPGTELFVIADLSRVWALADVYEHDIAQVQNGVAAVLVLDAYPERRFAGKVDFIYPTLEAATRTLRVRIAFDNREGLLKPGMYGEVEIALA